MFGQLNLTGIDSAFNVFSFYSTNIYGTGQALNQLNGINIIAPDTATILINVTGTNIQYGSYQIFRNGVAATRTQAKKILWNYPDALTWSNSTTAIYGSVLAPFATANGNAESHNELFIGELPDPTVCLLSTSSTTSSTTTTTTTSSTTTSSSTTTTSTTSSSTTTTSTTSSTTTTSTTSSTTSTTSSSTTTSTTFTTTTTTAAPLPRSPRCQAISDLLESVALQQAALSHILNAEGEKLQRIIAYEMVSHETILSANQSVESMVHSISQLEMILQDKLYLFKDCYCCDCENI